MKMKLMVLGASMMALILGIAVNGRPEAPHLLPQEKPSEAEAKAIAAVNTAPDTAAKLTAAELFVKAYPKSVTLEELSRYLVGHIAAESDLTQRLALAERFQKTFNTPKDLNAIRPVILSSYVGLKRTDDAFHFGESILAKEPENVAILIGLTSAGTEEAKRGNTKYVTQSQQYGLKVIEILEADKKHYTTDEVTWTYQKSLLPAMYQNVAILAVLSGKLADAKRYLDLASKGNPNDPFNFVLLGSLINQDYQELVKKLKTTTDAKEKEETLKSINSTLDSIIDVYAHAVALSADKPEYKQIHDQVLQDLTPYYKYRHNQSTEGLQELIDKYKPAQTPKP